MRSPADSKRIVILDLASRGYLPAQITREAGVSRQYVHAVLGGLVTRLRRDSPERQRDIRHSYNRAITTPRHPHVDFLPVPFDAGMLATRIRGLLADRPQ